MCKYRRGVKRGRGSSGTERLTRRGRRLTSSVRSESSACQPFSKIKKECSEQRTTEQTFQRPVAQIKIVGCLFYDNEEIEPFRKMILLPSKTFSHEPFLIVPFYSFADLLLHGYRYSHYIETVFYDDKRILLRILPGTLAHQPRYIFPLSYPLLSRKFSPSLRHAIKIILFPSNSKALRRRIVSILIGGGELPSALSPPSLQHDPAVLGFHPPPEPESSLPAHVTRLICSFHMRSVPFRFTRETAFPLIISVVAILNI